MSIDRGSCAVRETIVVDNSRERIRADRASRRRGRRAGARRQPFHRVPPRRCSSVRTADGGSLHPTDDRHRSSHAVHLWRSARHHLSGPVTLPVSRQPLRTSVQQPVTRSLRGSGAHRLLSQRVVRLRRPRRRAAVSPVPSHPPPWPRPRFSPRRPPRVKTHVPCATTHRPRRTMSADASERENEPGRSGLCSSKSGCGTRMGARRCAQASPLPLRVATAAR